jgi:Predicted membrane protein
MTEYIQALQKLLLQLTAAEQQDVVEYYREYLQEADITTYEAAVAELGTPQTVARKVLADYSIKMTEQPAGRQSTPAGTKANVKMIWLVILALLSTPVTIPLILVVGALVVAAGSVAFAGVVTVLALLVAGFAGGIVGVIVG